MRESYESSNRLANAGRARYPDVVVARIFSLLTSLAVFGGVCSSANVVPASAAYERPVLKTYKAVMGRKRAFIEESEPLFSGKEKGEPENGHPDWIRYGKKRLIRYSKENKAIRIRVRPPRALTCKEAIRWAGFKHAMPPLVKGSRCDWPGYSKVNGTGSRMAARYKEGVLDIWYAWKKR